MELGGAGRRADGDFSEIKVFLDIPKEETKWGSGDQAEFFKTPTEITIMIIII